MNRNHLIPRLIKLELMREYYILNCNAPKAWQACRLILETAKKLNKLSDLGLN